MSGWGHTLQCMTFELRVSGVFCVFGMALLASAKPSYAQQSEASFFEDLPTVLTASRLPQPINEAPGAVTVIEGDFIRATGYRDLARIFRLVPGMQVAQERGNQQWVTYHGMGNTFPSEMQVLIDGRSVYSPSSFGGVDWTALPLTVDEIDRIEVVRGTNAVTYGANAFLGVINIITRHTAEPATSRVRLNAGDSDILDAAASLGNNQSKVSWVGNVSTSHDDGYANLSDKREVLVASGRADWRVSSIDEVMLRIAGSQTTKGEGTQDSLFGNNAERDSHNDTGTFHVKWTRAPAADQELLLSYYRNQESIDDAWLANAGPGTYVPIDRNRTSKRDHLEFQHRFVPATDTQLVWGVEGRREEVKSAYLYSTRDSVTTSLLRGFGNLEWHFAQNWRANFGGAYERYSDEDAHLAPRAFINWQATPASTWRLGYGRAWQQRPTFEKYGDIRVYDKNSGVLLARPYQPNPDLKQARVDSAELGYLGRFTTFNSTLDVRVFHERISGYIWRVVAPDNQSLLAPIVSSSMYANRDQDFVLQGIEYQFKFQPWHQAEVIFNHALIDRNSGSDALDKRVAPYNASLTWVQSLGAAWRTQLTALRMGPLTGGDGFVPLSPYVAKPYTTFDARIAYLTSLGRNKLELALNAINLGPSHQELADNSEQAALALKGINTPANRVGRMVWLSATLDF